MSCLRRGRRRLRTATLSVLGDALASLPDALSIAVPVLIYWLSVGIYMHPLTTSPTPSVPRDGDRWGLIHAPKWQLDELHIASEEHRDVVGGTTPWTEAWRNDYWGRPLDGESSHKSWRPVAVWSFRFGKGGNVGRWFLAAAGRLIGGSIEGVLGLFGLGFRDDGPFAGPSDGTESLASELFAHRCVNVLIHVAIVQVIGAVATLLFRRDNLKNVQLYTKYIAQLLFAIHPVHVETVVNAANRPHILALLFNATIVDPGVPLVAVAVLAALGLLTAETAIFQLPAIMLTMTAIRHRELMEANVRDRTSGEPSFRGEERRVRLKPMPLVDTFFCLLPRYALLVFISLMYLVYRHLNDTLVIPTGLIRPAENPFYDKLATNQWTLQQRVMNYSYVLGLHIMKSFGVEIVGFSHEYGFDCIPEIASTRDPRLFLPAALLVFFAGLAVVPWCVWGASPRGGGKHTKRRRGEHEERTHRALLVLEARRRRREHEERTHRALLVLVFYAWTATLFPISGVMKVGTFVADRIAVASSFGTCVFAGRLLALMLAPPDDVLDEGKEGKQRTRIRSAGVHAPLKLAAVAYLGCTFSSRTHRRASQWMDSVSLLESSLEACPRSSKSNLEMSKIYSGLVPHMLDLEKSLSLIRMAESIDPTYCDIHQQYSHVYFQQSKYISFEEEMVKALHCPFSMGQAMGNWNKYWKVMLQGGQNVEARERYEKYMRGLQEDIDRAEKEELWRSRNALGRGVREEL